VIGTDIHGCRDSDMVAITVIQRVPTSVTPNDTLCQGESTRLGATGGVAYEWTPATGLDNASSANPVATPAVTTTYAVYIRENQCFTDTQKVTVVVNPQPTVNAGPDQVMFAGGSTQLFPTVTDATIFQWTPGTDLNCTDCKNPVVTPTHSETYVITVSNIYGCTASDSLRIVVKCDNSQIFLPNTFTPNGDGQNDRFYPHGKGITTVQRLRIYDRWGEVIYDMQNVPVNDATYGWDGTFRGQPLKPDTYIYVMDATCVTGEPLQVKGDISLIR
jgi:gliding motility-associated-like protein